MIKRTLNSNFKFLIFDIKADIVDDKSNGIEIVRILIEGHSPEIEILGWAEDITKTIALIDQKQLDLIFLDIEMTGANGFDQPGKERPKDLHVIIVTADSEYTVRAYRYSVADYLLKPVFAVELTQFVNKVKNLLMEKQVWLPPNNDNSKSTIRIPFNYDSVFVNVEDIIRMKADGAYTNIFMTGSRKYMVSQNIKIFEESVGPDSFMRVHRSHIINLNQVNKLSEKARFAEMTDGFKVEISRRVRRDFISRIQKNNNSRFI